MSDDNIYDDSLEGKDDLVEDEEEKDECWDDDDDEEDDNEEYFFDIITGKKHKKLSTLNKLKIPDNELDDLFTED